MSATITVPETAEAAVLYAVLTDPACMADIADTLRAADFGVQDYGTIYDAMLACHSRGQRPDMVTVSSELEARGHAHAASEVYRISPDAWVSSVYVTDYAGQVVKQSRRRAVTEQAMRLVGQLHNDPDADPVELAHTALQSIGALAADDDGPRMYDDVMDTVRERLTLQVAGAWEEQITATHLSDLDRQLGGGFRPGELVILGGRPGSGKTALMLQLAHNVARHNLPVLIFSGEMSMPSLVERGLSEATGIPMWQIRQKQIDRQRFDSLMEATDRLAGMPVGIDDRPGLTASQMLVRAQRFQRRHGLGLVLFDYLELAGDDAGKNGNETQRLGQISRGMKHMARTLDVPVLALSQLNRGVEQRTPPTPRMSDLRQSGGIEQDADIVLLIYRHDYYVQQQMADFDPAKAGTAEIRIGKQRNGPTGVVTVRFDEPTMRFQNMTRGEA